MSKTKDLVIEKLNATTTCTCRQKFFCDIHGVSVKPVQWKTRKGGADYWFNLITGFNK